MVQPPLYLKGGILFVLKVVQPPLYVYLYVVVQPPLYVVVQPPLYLYSLLFILKVVQPPLKSGTASSLS